MSKLSLGGLYSLTEWVAKFAYVNLLWIGFTLLGLIVFGYCPATVAMFTVLRKWVMGDRDIPVFSTFWNTYKKEFIKSNALGIIFAIIAGLIWIDLYYMKIDHSAFLKLAQIPLYLFIFAVIMTILYIFPVYVHYNVKFGQMFKNAFLIMLINPIHNIIMLGSIIAIMFVMKVLPGLLFFFGASITAAIIMASCYLAFQRIDSKKGKAHSIG